MCQRATASHHPGTAGLRLEGLHRPEHDANATPPCRSRRGADKLAARSAAPNAAIPAAGAGAAIHNATGRPETSRFGATATKPLDRAAVQAAITRVNNTGLRSRFGATAGRGRGRRGPRRSRQELLRFEIGRRNRLGTPAVDGDPGVQALQGADRQAGEHRIEQARDFGMTLDDRLANDRCRGVDDLRPLVVGEGHSRAPPRRRRCRRPWRHRRRRCPRRRRATSPPYCRRTGSGVAHRRAGSRRSSRRPARPRGSRRIRPKRRV